MNCRVNAYKVGLIFWQREEESVEKEREGRREREIMWKQRQKKDLSNRHTSRQIQTEIAWPTGFSCAILNHKLSHTLTCLLKLCQLSKYSVLAAEQVLHCAPTLNFRPRIPRFPNHKLLKHSCAGFLSLGLLEGRSYHHLWHWNLAYFSWREFFCIHFTGPNSTSLNQRYSKSWTVNLLTHGQWPSLPRG